MKMIHTKIILVILFCSYINFLIYFIKLKILFTFYGSIWIKKYILSSNGIYH